MPQVTLSLQTDDGQEETLTEYICDWPDCPNPAEHVVGVIRDLRIISVVCTAHVALITPPPC